MKTDCSPTVGVIILNWNNYQKTKDCIHSVEGQDYDNYRVYIVDNGSTDDSREKINSEFSNHNTIFNENNLGFSKGCNKGILQALSDGVDYILLLNNDVVVLENTISELTSVAEKDSNIGIVGGVMRRTSDGSVYSAGGEFQPYLARFSPETEPESYVYSSQFVTGAMMLISRSVFESLGELLNERYFFGMEDQEFSWKARQAGWDIVINPDAIAYHEKGGSAGNQNPFRYYHQTRNRFVFVQENLQAHQRWFFYIFFLLTRVYRFTQWIINNDVQLIKYTLLGVYDWLVSRYPDRTYLLDE